MNQANKDFVAELHRRSHKYEAITTKVKDLYDIQQSIRLRKSDVFKFLNKDVLSTGTSSLIRTPVVLKEDVGYSSQKTVELITLNHKGIGTLRENADGSTPRWGGTMSTVMREEDFYKFIFDDAMRTGVYNALVAQKHPKLARTFQGLCENIEHLREMEKAYTDADSNLGIDLPVPQVITHTKSEEEPRDVFTITNKEYKINRIEIQRDDAMILVYEATDSCGDPCRAEISARFGTTDTALIFMQFEDELQQALEEKHQHLITELAKIDVHIQKIEENLAAYAVMRDLKG